MKKYIIKGERDLYGDVLISGSKNLALPLLALSIALNKKCLFYNIPRIKDIEVFLSIFDYLKIEYKWIDKNSLYIDSSKIEYKDLCIEEVSRFRASYYLIPALLPFKKKLKINYPGGCNFEERPIDIHLQLFKDFGIEVIENTFLEFIFSDYKNNHIKLKNISFGATINAIIMAINSKNDITIENVSKECEIDSFIDCINKAGGSINRKGNKIIVKGNCKFKEVEFRNEPSRMEIGTFALFAAALGKIRIHPVNRKHLSYLEKILTDSNAFFYYVEDNLIVEKRKKPVSLIVETDVYPGFPTDLQPVLTSYMLSIPRIHILKEKVYKNRFSHVEELKKLGAMIVKEEDTLLINGIFLLNGVEMEARDLRGAVSLVFGALLAKGESIVSNIDYLERGYEDFYEKLRFLGADIGVVE